MDRISAVQRSENMRRIRSAGMKPEMIVRRLVYGLGFRYRLHRHDLPGRPDLVFASRSSVIQVHGCFWHQHPGCKLARMPKTRQAYWKQKLERNRARDANNLRLLEEKGWRVLVIWECETQELEQLKLRVHDFLTAGSQSSER